MTTIQTSAINKEHIKFRYSEPYTSEASNMQMGINDVGAYKGANVVATGSTSITIATASGESLVLHRNPSNGITTVVRVTGSVPLDLSSVGWPLASDTKLYVFMTVDYQLNQDTTGSWQVVDSLGDIPSGAVRLATLDLLTGATGISSDDVRTDGDHRDKILRQMYMPIPRRSMLFGSPGRVRVQINGKIYFMGGDTTVPKSSRVLFRGFSNEVDEPLVGSDGGVIVAGDWFPSELSVTPLQASDMDEDLCYDSPWVAFDFGDTSDVSVDGSFSYLYYRAVALEDINNVARDFGFSMPPHTTEILGKDIVGYPDALSQDTLTSQLRALLNLCNKKVDETQRDAATNTWSLLWRSNNADVDGDVDEDTVSVYFNANGMLIAKGGYIGSSDSFRTNVGVYGDISVLRFDTDNGLSRMKRTLSPGESPLVLYMNSPGDWETYVESDEEDTTFENLSYGFNFDEWASVSFFGSADTGSTDKYVQLFSTAGGRIRVYWGGSSNNDVTSFMITWGCRWNEGTSEWYEVVSSSINVRALRIGSEGVQVLVKSKDDADYSTGWADTAWTTEWRWGDDGVGETTSYVSGEAKETLFIPFSFELSEAHVLAMANTSYNGPLLKNAVTFKERRATTPAGPFSFAAFAGGDFTPYNVTLEQISSVGAVVSADCQSILSLLSNVTALSYIDATRMNIPAPVPGTITDEANWFHVGQAIGIRGSDNPGMWVIKEVGFSLTPSPVFTLTIDNSGDNAVHGFTTTGSTSDVVYFVKPSDNGKQFISTVVMSFEK